MLRSLTVLLFAITLSLSASSQGIPSDTTGAEATQGQHSEAIEYLLSAASGYDEEAKWSTVSSLSVGTDGGPDVVSKKCCKDEG